MISPKLVLLFAVCVIPIFFKNDQLNGLLVVPQAYAGTASQGYTTSKKPTEDRVALLIEIGKVRALLDAYHASASLFTASPSPYSPGISDTERGEWQAMLRSSVNQDTINSYQAIESLIDAPEGADIIEMLTRLASTESVSTATDNSRDNRDAKRIEYETARGVEDRLAAISDHIYPTRKEYFLVASALLRLGGDRVEKAINQRGEVVDLYQLLMARAYNWIADKSHPRWVSYCKGQSEPLAKLDQGLDHIDTNSAANRKGAKIEASASDLYLLASEAQKIAESMPNSDEQICS